MLLYNLRLAFLSIRQHPVLSGLMIAAIGVGIGACMTMLTVYYLAAKDPLPQKSDVVYAVQLDNGTADSDYDPENPPQPPQQLNYTDATNLLESDIPVRHAAMFKGAFSVQPQQSEVAPFLALGRVTTLDFFQMFDVPFLYGGAWSAEEARAASQVVVLSEETNETLFGGEDSVGRTITLDGREFRVTGVTESWNPSPKFYDVTNGAFNESEELFMPMSMVWPMQLDTAGNTNCNGSTEDINSFESFMASECRWISFWAEFANDADAERYDDYLRQYIISQQALNRFERPPNYSLLNVNDYLVDQNVANDDMKVMVWLSFLFLLVCLLNTIGLILAKLLARTPQIALRRALGASRLAVFRQYVVEIMLIGFLGGALGIVLSMLGLVGLKALMRGSAQLYSMDWMMVLTAIAISLGASILAGLYPAVRVSGLPPAASLKTQ